MPAEEEGMHGKLNGEEDRGRGIKESYAQLWAVVRLPAVRKLALVLLAFRLAVLPAEQAAPLKLLEKGVSKEALAGLVLSLSLSCPACKVYCMTSEQHRCKANRASQD